MQQDANTLQTRLLTLAPLLIAATFMTLAWRFIVDDSYIVNRYIVNTLSHGVVSYNPTDHVNALTSPLQYFIILALTPLFPDHWFDAFRWTCAIAIVLSLYGAAFRIFSSDKDRFVYLCLSLCSPFMAIWAVGGLETCLLAALCQLFLAHSVRPFFNSAGANEFLKYSIAGIAFLTRFDSVLFFFAPCLLAILKSQDLKRTAIFLAIAALPALAWLGFAFFYYGDIFPTSLYLKGGFATKQLALGTVYFVFFICASGLWFFLPHLRLSPRVVEASERTPLLRDWRLWSALLVIIYGWHAGAVHMMHAYRYWVVYLPFFVYLLMGASKIRGSVSYAAMMVFQCAVFFWAFFIGFDVNPAVVANVLVLDRIGHHVSTEFAESRVPLWNYDTALFGMWRTVGIEAREHWIQRGRINGPVFASPLGGVPPYFFPESIAYDSLTGYRDHCNLAPVDVADYKLELEMEAPKGPSGEWEPVSSHAAVIDQGQTVFFNLYYRPRSATRPAAALPPRIHDKCDGAGAAPPSSMGAP